MSASSAVRPGNAILASVIIVFCTGCTSSENHATRVLADSIDRYGGERFDDIYVRFEFRGTPFELLREGGRFRYQRTVTDSAGRAVTEIMENSGTWIERDGARVELDSAELYRVETDVNSVVYFGFLPFRLDDPAVVAEHLGEVEVAGEPYHEIGVGFGQDGGGVDWDTRFVYWIHRDDLTVDYLVYRYTRDGGGTRFRRAVNRREIGGLLIQDYENYAAREDVEQLEDYDRLFEEGALELASMIELENVEVLPSEAFEDGPTPADEGPATGSGGDEEELELGGIETMAGVDRATYGPDDSVRVTIRAVNRGDEPRVLRFPTAMRYDIVLTTDAGQERYRWSEGQAFAQVVGDIPLAPGDSLVFEELVPAPDELGAYELTAVIPTRSGSLEVRLPIEVR